VSRRKWESKVPAWGAATREQHLLLDAAWRSGDLTFLLTPSQADSHKKIRRWQQSGMGRVFGLDISRRWGKSALITTLGLEDAIRHPGWRIVYLAPTYQQVKNITLPLISMLIQSCPPKLRPKWIKSELYFEFGNGTRLELIGLDTRPDGARGSAVDLVLLDEAAFFDQLEYLLVSVIYPQMLGRAHARVIAASTPPVTPAHYWTTDVIPDCISRKAHDKKTLDDADQYSEEEIETEYARMPGGRNGVTARREYGAEHIADESMQIVPEFGKAEASIVRVVEPPVWRDCYVALDPGYHDMSAALFGYWSFLEQTLVVEDEIIAPRLNSRDLANAIKAKEAKLWSGVVRRGGGNQVPTKPQPYLRISDNDPRLIADMRSDHGLLFIPTQRDNLVQQVDQVRVAIQEGKIAIHPRCRKLIAHLRHGVWKKIGSLFARESDMGHFDAIAALVYLWRNVQKRRNPTPQLERFVMDDMRVPLPPRLATRTPPPGESRWEQSGEKMRRKGQLYLIKTGKRQTA
jgi:hypothetical protein